MWRAELDVLPDSFFGAGPGGLPRVETPFSFRFFFALVIPSFEAAVGFFLELCSCASDTEEEECSDDVTQLALPQ